MTSIRGKNKWPTSFCQAGHCCFYHILSTFLITGQKKGRMECIRFSWKLMHIQAVWYFSRKSNFFLLLIPTLVFPYSFSQTFQNDFTFQIWKKFFFFLTDTGFWRNREQSSMAKAGRPYFKRYETKITDHNVRIRRFFCSRLQCHKLITTLLTLLLRSLHLCSKTFFTNWRFFLLF